MLDLNQYANNLDRREDGVWYAPTTAAVSYPDDGHEQCAEIEAGSFWFKHRNACITALLDTLPPPDLTVFDIGGGNGFVASALQSAGYETVVVEPGESGASKAATRNIPNVICAALQDAQFKRGSLPAVGLFDVVEHIEDDVSFMQEIGALLAPGGRVYLTVPAYQWLWSDADDAAGHFRRHTTASMTTLLQRAGLGVDYATYFFRFLPLPVFVLRAMPARLGLTRQAEQVQQDHAGAGAAAGLVEFILRPEVENIGRLKAMRFGGSCLIAASKLN